MFRFARERLQSLPVLMIEPSSSSDEYSDFCVETDPIELVEESSDEVSLFFLRRVAANGSSGASSSRNIIYIHTNLF